MNKPIAEKTIPVIIDTDMGVDDWMAILYLLKHPKVNLRAITITGTGLSPCELGLKNAFGLLRIAAQDDIPVACGSSKPLRGDHSFRDEWRITEITAKDLLLPAVTPLENPSTAVEMLSVIIEGSSEKVTIVALGPLTNLAMALHSSPKLVQNIEMIYIMGGAVYVPGNVGQLDNGIINASAEWNLYIDPEAASLVFNSGVPLTLIPLDATNCAPVTKDFLQHIEREAKTTSAKLISRIVKSRETDIQKGEFFFWDPLAAVIATDEGIAEIEERNVVVVVEDGSENGRTKDDIKGHKIRVALSANSIAFEKLYIDVLNH